MLHRVAAVRRPSAAALVTVSLVTECAVLVPWLYGRGEPLDEGALLSYGDLVFRGYLPGRDLRTFYGPLNSYVVGAALWVSGGSFYAERLVGLAYQLTIAAALLLLVRPRGRMAVVAATGLLVVLPPESLSATAVRGASAASCVAVLAASRRRPFLAGAAAGFAVGLRYDWAVPLALAAIPWLVGRPRRERLRLLASSAGFTGLIYVPYLVLLGPTDIRYAWRLLHAAELGRRKGLPAVTTPTGSLFYLVVVAIGVLLVVGFARRATTDGKVFLSIALMSAGLIPYMAWTANRTHVLTGGVAPVVLCAAAAPALLEEVRGYPRRWLLLGGCAALAVAPLAYQTVAAAIPPSTPLFPPKAYAVTYHGRMFRLDNPEEAAAAQVTVRRAAALSPHGGRLFVGPGDLADPGYADAYLYYLLANRLRPATFFIVFDPGTASLAPHRLADELPRADVVVLNRSERTETSQSGPGAAQVLARDFCIRGMFGSFSVYARCRSG